MTVNRGLHVFDYCNYVKLALIFVEGGDSLIKVGTDVQALALGILGVNFCLGIRFREGNFARALGFCNF